MAASPFIVYLPLFPSIHFMVVFKDRLKYFYRKIRFKTSEIEYNKR